MSQLPPGWTEHTAPTGHTYWHHAKTGQSTYDRPAVLPALYPPPMPAGFQLPVPAPAPAVPTVTEKKEKKEKPKKKEPIEGSPWTRVTTNKGNVFFTNRETKESVWTVPDEIKDLLLKLDAAAAFAQAEDDEDDAGDRGTKRPVEDAEDEEAEAEEEEPVKKKAKRNKPKKTIVRDLSNLDDVLVEPRTQPKPDGEDEVDGEEDHEGAVEQDAEDEMEEEQPAAAAAEPPAEKPAAAPLPTISPEEAAAMYKLMLSEKNIDPMAPWDMELPKFVHDPRYTAVRNSRDRRDLFDEFCKVKIRENRAEKKRREQENGGKAADPAEAYKALLKEKVTSTRTLFSDFKSTHALDPRFRAYGKVAGDAEKVFKSHLRELGEQKRVEAQKREEAFEELLKAEVNAGEKWEQVKDRLRERREYKDVGSSSLREDIFKKFQKAQQSKGESSSGSGASKAAPAGESKAERASRSLREREEQVRREKAKAEQSRQAAVGHLGREEGEREVRSCLVDLIRDHRVRWSEAEPVLIKDARWTDSQLPSGLKRRLFEDHLETLHNKRLDALERLFAQKTASPLVAKWAEVVDSLVDAQESKWLFSQASSEREGREALRDLWERWVQKEDARARREFRQLLDENPVIQHWGRLRKEEESKKLAVIGTEGEAVEDEDDVDVKDMARQVGVAEVHATLKNDKRYTDFSHMPEERNQWIVDYLAALEKPKMTVHQK